MSRPDWPDASSICNCILLGADYRKEPLVEVNEHSFVKIRHLFMTPRIDSTLSRWQRIKRTWQVAKVYYQDYK